MEKELFVCDCGNIEHQFVLSAYSDEYIDVEFYLSPYLSNYKSFFSRILYSIKYILGHKCKDSAFDTIILNKESAKRLALKILKEVDNANRMDRK
jgi:hypothetical protein